MSVIQVSSVHYPESDGRPMGETDEHRDAMVRHIELLHDYYRGQRVYVSGDLLVYFEQGNPKKFVVPDCFVVKGIDPSKRRTYKVWVEGRAPDVAIETTSLRTKRKDTVTKPDLYARLRVKEYFLFDPTQEYLDPPLQGHRLAGNHYEPIPAEKDGSLVSQELGLRLKYEQGVLVFYRLDTAEPLLSREQMVAREAAAHEAAEERARQEAAARKTAEDELEKLRRALRRDEFGQQSAPGA
jgi:Uma2 family endonuclease